MDIYYQNELNEKQKYNNMAVTILGSMSSLLIPVKRWSLHMLMVHVELKSEAVCAWLRQIQPGV